MKKRVVIIGCGFAGFYAANFLSRFRKEIELVVIDRRDTFDFLPALPDLIGRGIDPDCLASSIYEIGRKYGFNFIKDEVVAIDLENRIIQGYQGSIKYDYLIIASGTETNFYGNSTIKDYAFTIDSVLDLKKVSESLKNRRYNSYLISGGGYTGVEVATNLRRFFDKNSIDGNIIIVEKGPSILGPLPQWMKDYTIDNLKKLKVDILTNTSIAKIEEDGILLSSGQKYLKPMLFWVAGVKTAGFIQNLEVEKNPQGRVKVDGYLRIKDNCFVVGDCANIAYQNSFLRMAVQFSIYEAVSAAKNVMRSIKGGELKIYKPLDMGYIIPMANNKSCGEVLGLSFRGVLPTLMHFSMCIYRLNGLKNKIKFLKGLLKGGF